MPNISNIQSIEVLDSRGYPTIATSVTCSEGALGYAMVPSGASTGQFEACELRDEDPKRYFGKGVKKACAHIQDIIAPVLQGMDVAEQALIDQVMIELDGTLQKSRLGANAILSVSLACADAAAKSKGLPLYASLISSETYKMPVPMINVINGGMHANNKIDVQEFMIMPVGAPSFKEALRWGSECFHALGLLLKKHGYSTSVGDEGGYAPNLSSNEAVFDFLSQAVEQAGYRLGEDIVFALDVAASELRSDDAYQMSGLTYTFEELSACYLRLKEKYPLVSIEDGFADDDIQGWAYGTKALGGMLQLVGDDLFVTQAKKLSEGIESSLGNAILIKLNQVGTLTETLASMALAKKAGYRSIVSHRSGETEDTFIADLAVATSCGQIKTGSLCRSERIAKYNRLLMIEAALGHRAVYQNPFIEVRSLTES